MVACLLYHHSVKSKVEICGEIAGACRGKLFLRDSEKAGDRHKSNSLRSNDQSKLASSSSTSCTILDAGILNFLGQLYFVDSFTLATGQSLSCKVVLSLVCRDMTLVEQ